METPLRSVPEPVEGQLDSLDENRSFERFFDAERTRLFGALAVMSGNRAEAEEVMQDAFLKVWERWGRVSAMESPEGFLYRTALNLYRKRLRRAAIAVRKATTLLPEDDALGGVETRDEVARLLRGLTQREREAIVVTAYLGYSKRRPASCWGSGEHRARAHVEGSRHSPTTGHGGTNVIDEREIRVAVERLAPPEPRTSDWCADATASAGTSAAGVVGIAVFVAAVWIVTSVGSFDRTQTPAVPGPAQTGPAETDYLLDLDTGVMTPPPKSIGGDGSNEYAASPDGSRLAYIGQGDNGEQQIFVANLDGTGIEQVTHDLEAAFSPAWSPTARRSPTSATTTVATSLCWTSLCWTFATGTPTQLTFSTLEPDPDLRTSRASPPSFTPDGSSIVYGASRGDDFEVRVVRSPEARVCG